MTGSFGATSFRIFCLSCGWSVEIDIPGRKDETQDSCPHCETRLAKRAESATQCGERGGDGNGCQLEQRDEALGG